MSEEPFKNQRFHITEEKDGYNIYNYVSQSFSILIRETMTWYTCNQNNPLRVLKDDSFITHLREISN